MTIQTIDRSKAKILRQALQAFRAFGYTTLTMAKLAEVCGLSRRGLYHHYKNKKEVFREALRLNNMEDFEAGDAAGKAALARGAGAVDVIAEWLDARFGNTRRTIGVIANGRDLNDAAFRLASDIMIEVSYESNRKLAELVDELVRRGDIRLRKEMTAEKIGRLLGDAARGVNQARPPVPNNLIGQHYRDIAEAILFGSVMS